MGSNEIIGITGGIGSGKSVVCRILRCNGKFVYDCDSEAKRLMETSAYIKENLKKELGREIYGDNDKLNRELMASIIFRDEGMRRYVNSIVHQAVKEDIINKNRSISKEMFVESAILASSGLASICDSIWLVEAPLDKRIDRVLHRDKTERKSVELRIKSQEEEMQQVRRYKVIEIINDGIEPMLPRVLNLINKFNINQIYTQLC